MPRSTSDGVVAPTRSVSGDAYTSRNRTLGELMKVGYVVLYVTDEVSCLRLDRKSTRLNSSHT